MLPDHPRMIVLKKFMIIHYTDHLLFNDPHLHRVPGTLACLEADSAPYPLKIGSSAAFIEGQTVIELQLNILYILYIITYYTI